LNKIGIPDRKIAERAIRLSKKVMKIYST